MHVRIITFGIEGISHEQFEASTLGVATAFNDLPGLLAKVWLGDAATGVYGGVYVFDSAESAAQAEDTELFRSIGANPHFRDVSVRELGVLDEPTRLTAMTLLRA